MEVKVRLVAAKDGVIPGKLSIRKPNYDQHHQIKAEGHQKTAKECRTHQLLQSRR